MVDVWSGVLCSLLLIPPLSLCVSLFLRAGTLWARMVTSHSHLIITQPKLEVAFVWPLAGEVQSFSQKLARAPL